MLEIARFDGRGPVLTNLMPQIVFFWPPSTCRTKFVTHLSHVSTIINERFAFATPYPTIDDSTAHFGTIFYVTIRIQFTLTFFGLISAVRIIQMLLIHYLLFLVIYLRSSFCFADFGYEIYDMGEPASPDSIRVVAITHRFPSDKKFQDLAKRFIQDARKWSFEETKLAYPEYTENDIEQMMKLELNEEDPRVTWLIALNRKEEFVGCLELIYEADPNNLPIRKVIGTDIAPPEIKGGAFRYDYRDSKFHKIKHLTGATVQVTRFIAKAPMVNSFLVFAAMIDSSRRHELYLPNVPTKIIPVPLRNYGNGYFLNPDLRLVYPSKFVIYADRERLQGYYNKNGFKQFWPAPNNSGSDSKYVAMEISDVGFYDLLKKFSFRSGYNWLLKHGAKLTFSTAIGPVSFDHKIYPPKESIGDQCHVLFKP